MQSLRVLDRFLPSEAYLLTLLGAHHVEMIREEQLLNYLDRGMGIANRDARTALVDSVLLSPTEIEELDHFLERKLERGPREFRAVCRSMLTPSLERVLRVTRNEDARRLSLDSPVGGVVAQAASSGGNGSSTSVAAGWDDEPEDKPKAQSHPWIKAAVAIGLLLMVALAAVMPMDKKPPAEENDKAARFRPAGELAPDGFDAVSVVRDLYLILPNQEAVVAHLTKDPCLRNNQRIEALEIARNETAVARLLNNASWYVVRSRESSQSACQRSFELAAEAYRLAPGDGTILNTVGVAQYRLGHYPEALKVLGKSYEMNKNALQELPADVAFLTMCYAQMGLSKQAKEELAKLKRLMIEWNRRNLDLEGGATLPTESPNRVIMALAEESVQYSRSQLMSFSEFTTTGAIKELFSEEIIKAGGVVSDVYDDGSLLFARSVFPKTREVAAGDKLQGGVALRANSTQLGVHPYVFRLMCSNGAIIAQTIQSLDMKFADFPVEYEFAGTLRHAVRECSADEVFAKATWQMRSAADAEVDVALTLLPLMSRFQSNPRLAQSMAQAFRPILERFLGESNRSRFALMNAITSVARDTQDPELRWNLEEMGGGIPLSIVPKVPQKDGTMKLELAGSIRD
jgi:tetratricopeptide (TPR) repeat protein